MKINNLVFIILLGIMLLPMVVASDPAMTLTLNSDSNITLQVLEKDNSPTTATTTCTLSLGYPGQPFYNGLTMYYISNGYFTTSVSSIIKETGKYAGTLNCENSGGEFLSSSFTLEIKPAGNIWFTMIIFGLAIVFLICTLFVSEEVFVYLSGVCFLIGGIYVMINGLDTIYDWASRSVAYVTLGLGLLFTVGAYIYNGYNKGAYEEDD